MSGELVLNNNIVGTFIRNGIIFSNRPRIVKKVLWTNPNASATLAATTVTLADDINNYDYIGVKYRQHTSRPEKNGTIYITVEAFKDCQATSNVQRLSFGPISRNNYTTYVRPFFYTNDTTIDIGQATYGTTVGNGYSIPEVIFGVKEEFETVNGTDQYSYQGYKSLAASTIPSFTTVAKAKAVWILYTLTSSAYRSLALTNVNPYTSVVDNDTIYQIDTAYPGRAVLTENKFIVTDNEVKTLNPLGSQAVNVSIIYTYGEPKDDPPSEETVLWTNPNASTGFARTTVTLSDNISNYKYIKIRTKPLASDTNPTHIVSFITPTSEFVVSASINNYLSVISYFSSAAYARRFAYQTDTTILIFESFRLNAAGSSNDGAIPIDIIGIK